MVSKKSVQFKMADGRAMDFDAINQGTYAGLNAITLTKIEAGYVEGEIDIRSSHLNPNGFLHGGVSTTLADTLAIFGCVYLYQTTAVSTVNLNVSFLRPVKTGTITAKGKSLSKGKHVSQWRVQLFDPSSTLFAEASITVAVSK